MTDGSSSLGLFGTSAPLSSVTMEMSMLSMFLLTSPPVGPSVDHRCSPHAPLRGTRD